LEHLALPPPGVGTARASRTPQLATAAEAPTPKVRPWRKAVRRPTAAAVDAPSSDARRRRTRIVREEVFM
jgi:hypothetical protein